MKILAIRGRNLASLGGDFSVELARAPLSGAGIFAISGPTGAGKTTLLDALCLALFDRTPRLSDRGGVRVGMPGEDDALWVASQDVRALLRKGCAGCHAEVDFTGRDGRVYRARWSVRRARDRADGQLQAQSMSLQVLETGEILGRTKSDVLTEIEARLGLSFEQFRRSALLAQGDFAAFLKAGERERAELLEQMTGTGLYGQLSIQAHERSRQEQRRLEEMRGRLGEVRVLSLEERSALQQALARSEAEAEESRQRLVRVEEARASRHQLEALMAQEQEATAQLADAQRAWEGAAASQAELARAERLLSLAPLRDRIEQARGASEEAVREAASRQREAELAQREREAAGEARRVAHEALEAARAEQAEIAPRLQEATLLDAERVAAERRAEELLREEQEGQRGVHEMAAQGRALQGSLTEAEGKRQQARDELARLSFVARIAPDWEQRWRRMLGRYYHAARELSLIDRASLVSRSEAARELARREASALTEREERQAREGELVRLAEERAAGFDATSLRTRREWLAGQQTRLAALLRLADEAWRLHEQQLAAEQGAEQASADREGETRKATQASTERTRLEATLQEAQHALQQTSAALDLSSRRALLVEGEPCPLCGGQEHPWAHEAPPLGALVVSQKKRVEQLTAARQLADRDEISARARMHELRKRADEERERGQQLARGLHELSLQARQHLSALALDALPTDLLDPALRPALLEVERAFEQQFFELRAQAQQAEETARSVAQARRDLDEARQQMESARERSTQATRASEAQALELARAEETLARRRDEQQSILDEIAPVFEAWPGWREEMTSDIEAFGKACATHVTARLRHEAALAEAEARVSELNPALQAALARSAERQATLERSLQTRREHQRTLGALHERRAALLGGRPVALVAAELQATLGRAEAAEQSAIVRHEDTERHAAATRAAADASVDLVAHRRRELDDVSAELDAQLAHHQADRATLELVLATPASGWQQRREALEQLRTRLAQAETIAAERRARLEQHRAVVSSLGEGSEEAAEQASRELAEAEARLSTARVRLADDDEHQARASVLGAELRRQQQQLEVWAALAGLIGSADGKKLRVFAQSLTFDSLLLQANVHLDELARRYQLMRVPGTDLDLQIIDREMADEVRPTTSLSGGESFLISLALALALSSLGSRDTRVDTLFIDEGFGTLDADSLEIALAALDALQSTGRQVGLISHIPGLVERLGTHIRVQPCGGGRSVVHVVDGAPSLLSAG